MIENLWDTLVYSYVMDPNMSTFTQLKQFDNDLQVYLFKYGEIYNAVPNL